MATQPYTYDAPPMLPAGSRVVVIVSVGPFAQAPRAFAEVPEVVGANQNKALTAFQESGLSTKLVNDYSDVLKRGEVIGQLPPPHARVPTGSEAVLLVSSGPAPHEQRGEVLPDVVGRTEAEAVAMLQAASLSPQIVREHSATVPAGVVMAQLPSRESLAEYHGRKTRFWPWAVVGTIMLLALIGALLLLRPVPDVPVPDVVGMEQAEAVTAIEKAGLVAKIEALDADAGYEGVVVRQVPEPGEEIREGSQVTIEVPAPTEMVAVPDVVGEDQSTARRILGDAGLESSISREDHLTVAKGLVIRQDPGVNRQVEAGSVVTVVISSGPPQTNVKVPDVVGLVSSDAVKTLTDAGLKPVVAESSSATVAKDVVITQLPAAGDSVAPGTSVGIVVSTGAGDAGDQAKVPDVVGLTLAEAQQVVSDAGFDAVPVAASGSGQPANEVVATAPAADAEAQAGSSVVLFYSAGP